MADSLFDKDDNQQFDDNKDYLAELTGPGGKFDRTKYQTEADMYKAIAKSNAHADNYIKHKNQEHDQLREDYLNVRAENIAKAKFQDLVTKFENPGNDDDTKQPPTAGLQQPPTFDPKQLDNIIAEKLSAIEIKRREDANIAVVEARLRERLGENAKAILKDKMNTLGISDDDIKFLAKKSPEAVFNALGLNQQQQETYSLPKSNIRSDGFKPNVVTRDAVYYEKLRKENPKEYYSEKMSVQRLKDMSDPDFLTRYNSQRTQY